MAILQLFADECKIIIPDNPLVLEHKAVGSDIMLRQDNNDGLELNFLIANTPAWVELTFKNDNSEHTQNLSIISFKVKGKFKDNTSSIDPLPIYTFTTTLNEAIVGPVAEFKLHQTNEEYNVDIDFKDQLESVNSNLQVGGNIKIQMSVQSSQATASFGKRVKLLLDQLYLEIETVEPLNLSRKIFSSWKPVLKAYRYGVTGWQQLDNVSLHNDLADRPLLNGAHWSKRRVIYNKNAPSGFTISGEMAPTEIFTRNPSDNVTLATELFNSVSDLYYFNGWRLGNAESGTIVASQTTIAVAADQVEYNVYANWTKKHVVTFIPEEGATYTQTLVKPGESMSLTTPSKDGYAFNGWWTAKSGGTFVGKGGATYTPSGDITLYGHWLKAYTIKYWKTAELNWAAASVTPRWGYMNLTEASGPVTGTPPYLDCQIEYPAHCIAGSVKDFSAGWNGNFTSRDGPTTRTIAGISWAISGAKAKKDAVELTNIPEGTKLTFTLNNRQYHGGERCCIYAGATTSSTVLAGPSQSISYTYTVSSDLDIQANWKTSGEYVPVGTEVADWILSLIGGSATDDRNSWWDLHIIT